MEDRTFRAFVDVFGERPTVLARSPGRVNLIGEHTDYNEGWVLPAALNLGTTVAARPRPDGVLHTLALRFKAEDQSRLDDLRPREGPEWTRYVRGMAAMLLEAGCELMGADLVIGGDLPLRAGLSSSASLEMGVAVTLAALAGCTVDPNVLARLGQQAENEIVGVRSGIMDQLAAACGEQDHALLIDCRTLKVEPVPIPPDVRILVLESGVSRTLAGSAYNQRRAECESALHKLQTARPDLQALRDVTPELLEVEARRLSPVEVRRVRHVVTENERVLESSAALRRGDVIAFGQFMVASHASLRDDYQVSSPELDELVTIALASPGVFGARLTGAGFGGCAVALVESRQAERAAQAIPEHYRRATGRAGDAYICYASDGAYARWSERKGEQRPPA